LSFNCSSPFPDYPPITINYHEQYVDSTNAFIKNDLYFEPILGFTPLTDDIKNELLKRFIIDEDSEIIVEQLMIYADTLGQLIVVSEILPINGNSVFPETMNYFTNLYNENISLSMKYRINNTLINQLLINIDDRVIVKVVFTHLTKNKIGNTYMIEYMLFRNNYHNTLKGVESSIASILKQGGTNE